MQVRLITLTYAAVFAVEGIGLWMQRRWAEWLTVIITASLIPLELWELIHRPSLGAALVLLANCLIVGYLVLARVDPPASPRRRSLDKAPPRRDREMIFISDEFRRSGVFFASLVKPSAGDPMI